jgi:hypothetical protein
VIPADIRRARVLTSGLTKVARPGRPEVRSLSSVRAKHGGAWKIVAAPAMDDIGRKLAIRDQLISPPLGQRMTGVRLRCTSLPKGAFVDARKREATAQARETILEDVVITSELQKRPTREFDLQRENDSFRELADHFARDPDKFLDRMVELALVLCDADTVGVSVEQTDEKGQRIFRWVAMAGSLRHLIGGTTPRHFSPCGICVDQNAPLLMERLDRFYPYFKEAPLPFIEALLIPWEVRDGPNGTLWVVAHSERRKFDQQDVRLMGCLAAFTCGAIRLQQTLAMVEQVSGAAKVLNAVAHRINNPLQAVMLALSCALSGTGLSKEARTMITIAEKELQRVADLSAELTQQP